MKYIIWDWNGTLFNDIDACIKSINTLLKKYNLNQLPNRDSYRSVFSFPIEDYYRKLGFDFSKDSFEKLGAEFIDYYHQNSKQSSLADGAIDILEMIKSKGYRQIILSASKKENLLKQVESFGISHYFDEILGIGDIYAKSKVGLAYDWRDRTKYSEVIAIGDSYHDLDIAKAVGAKSILTTSGHQHIAEPEDSEYNRIENLNEIGSII